MKTKLTIRHYPNSDSFCYVFGLRFLIFYFHSNSRKLFKYSIPDSNEDYGDTRSIPENKRFFSRMSKFKD